MTHSYQVSATEAKILLSADKPRVDEFLRAQSELRNWFRVELRHGSIARLDSDLYAYWPAVDFVNVGTPVVFECCAGTEITYPTPGNSTECPVCHSTFHVQGTDD
jgi:hypothetical protein